MRCSRRTEKRRHRERRRLSPRVEAPRSTRILDLVGRHTAAGRAVAVAPGREDRERRARRHTPGLAPGRPVPAASPAAGPQAVDVAFSQGGSLLVTAGADGVARVWGADDGEAAPVLHSRRAAPRLPPSTAARRGSSRAAPTGIARVFDPHGRRALHYSGTAAAPSPRLRSAPTAASSPPPARTSRGGSGAREQESSSRQAGRPPPGRL